MDALVKSLNTTLDIELFNFKQFSQTTLFMMAGMKYLQNKYKNKIHAHEIPVVITKDNQLSYNLDIHTDKMYTFVPLIIRGEIINHVNVLIFYANRNNVICERYDPQYSCCINEQFQRRIDTVLTSEFSKTNIIYVSPESMGIIVCPQSYIKDNFGYCQTYTLLYIDNFMKNTGKNRLEVISSFPSIQDLHDHIKTIVKFILQTTALTEKHKNILINYDTMPGDMKDYIINYIFRKLCC